MYLRTSRLDLDDYNHEADEGLHITSMAGTWMSVVEGMAGVRIDEKSLRINPIIPDDWTSYSFNMLYRALPLTITIDKQEIKIKNNSAQDIEALVNNEKIVIKAKDLTTVSQNQLV
jgi:maltose phosphorylase